MKCAKCGFEQPDDIYCAQCGVEVLKYQAAHKETVRRWELTLAAAGVIIAAGLGAWMFLSGEKEKNTYELITHTLEAPSEITRSRPITEPVDVADTIPDPITDFPDEPIVPEPPADEPEPIPNKRLPKTMEEDILVTLPPGDAIEFKGKAAKGFRLYAAHDGQMIPIPFQIDTGWTPPEEAELAHAAQLLVMSSDLGDLDDKAYPPRGYESLSRMDFDTGEGNGKGWAYLLNFDFPPDPPTRAYVQYNELSRSLDAKSYQIEHNPDHPATLTKLSIGGAGNILDRQKLRLIIGNEIWTEEDIHGKISRVVTGPLLVRTQWNGTLQLSELVPILVESEYMPDGWKTTYVIDLSSLKIKSATMRIYFDLSQGEGADGLKIITPGDLAGKKPDGKSGRAKPKKGRWFMLAGENYALKVSTETEMTIFYLDDVEFFDPPEYESGCWGCIGFEMAAAGTVQFVVNYEVIYGYTPGQPPPSPTSPGGKLVVLE